MNKKPAFYFARYLVNPKKFAGDPVKFTRLKDKTTDSHAVNALHQALRRANLVQAPYIIKLLLQAGDPYLDPLIKKGGNETAYDQIKKLTSAPRKNVLKGFIGYYLTLSDAKQKGEIKELIDNVKDNDAAYRDTMQAISDSVYYLSTVKSPNSKSYTEAKTVNAPLDEFVGQIFRKEKEAGKRSQKIKEAQSSLLGNVLSVINTFDDKKIEVALNALKPKAGINKAAGADPLLIIAVKKKAGKVIDAIFGMSGVELVVRGRDNKTPLQLAINKRDHSLITKLVNAEDGQARLIHNRDTRDSAILLAVKTKQSTVVDAVLLGNPYLEDRDENGDTAYLASIKLKQWAIMNKLMDEGARINIRDNYNNTPLLLMVQKGSKSDVQKMLNLGADVNAQNNNGETPFLLALKGGNQVVADLLWVKKPDVKKAQNISGYRPLHYAAKGGMTNLVTEFIKAGAEPNVRTKDGWTPLHFAAKEGHLGAVKELLAKGAMVSALNKNNRTPERLAKTSAVRAALRRASGRRIQTGGNGQPPVARAVARVPARVPSRK